MSSFVFHQFIVYSNMFLGQSWEGPQIHVESLATAMVMLQVMQFVLYHARFGPKNHWPVRWVAWAAYYVPVPVAVLAVAAMLQFRYPPYWLVAIFFAAGQAETKAAYSLRDGDKQSVRRFAKRALPFAYLALVLFHRGDDGAMTTISSLRRKEIFSLVLGFLAVVQDQKINRRAMVPPSEICKLAADHVRFEAQRRRRRQWGESQFADDDDEAQEDRPSVVAVGSLESYQTAVSGCTTREDIRFCSCSRRLEDACLSSALFLELLQRYGPGYSSRRPPHVARRSSANRAFTDLLPEPEAWQGWEYDRAFEIVKVQLSFMKDYFFSANGGGSPSRTSYRLYGAYSLLKISFLLSVLTLVTEEKETPRRSTRASLYALILLQLCQFFGYLNSERFLVSYMCDRREDLTDIVEAAPLSSSGSIFVAIPVFLFEVLVGEKPKVHLGHYSLVEDFDRTCMMQRLMARLLGRRRPQMQRGTHISPPDKKCKLIKSHISSGDRSSQFNMLKRWICDKVAANDSETSSSSEPRRFSFGEQSMRACDSLGFRVAWTLKQETRIHTILIWHIATWFCDMSFSLEDVKFLRRETLFPGAYTFATMLSSYCAYLVAERPELLHEHPSLTRSVLDQVVKEAKRCFESGTSSEERYQILKNWSFEVMIDYPSHFPRLLSQGIKLGHFLMIYSTSERWEIMADFWAEMVLFMAGSGNAAAHIEHLARGDEFMTQLWALLSNAWDRTAIRRNNNDGDSDEFVRRSYGILLEAFEAVLDKTM